MPVMNGVEAAREIRGSHLVRKLTVMHLPQPVGHLATVYMHRIQTLSGASMATGRAASGTFSEPLMASTPHARLKRDSSLRFGRQSSAFAHPLCSYVTQRT